MTFDANWPVPIIDLLLGDGCGVCVDVCPSSAFELKDGKAVISASGTCDYTGICELVCPVGAITRPFLLVPPVRQ